MSGGSSGLGLATVQSLLASGSFVSILDRAAPPSSVSSESRVKYIETDITVLESIQSAVSLTVEWAKASSAPLGGVINSAGVGVAAKIVSADGEPHDLDLWRFVLDVNLTGTFNLTRLALPHLLQVAPEGEDQERGVIIMVSSAAAFEGQPGQTAYSASKGALRSMTLPLARDLARYGIRVVTIAPGVFESAMSKNLPPKAKKSLVDGGVLFPKRFGEAREFAETVKWVLECAYVNGETLRLSGGGRLPGKL